MHVSDVCWVTELMFTTQTLRLPRVGDFCAQLLSSQKRRIPDDEIRFGRFGLDRLAFGFRAGCGRASFIFPRNIVTLPDVGKALAAFDGGDTFFKGKGLAGGIGLDRLLLAEELAEVVEMGLGGGAFAEIGKLPAFDEILEVAQAFRPALKVPS